MKEPYAGDPDRFVRRPDGGLDYFNSITLTLERARNLVDLLEDFADGCNQSTDGKVSRDWLRATIGLQAVQHELAEDEPERFKAADRKAEG